MTKIRLGLLFGGRSVEHEVSIASATSIHKALDPARYDVTLLAVDREGRWHRGRCCYSWTSPSPAWTWTCANVWARK